MRTVDEIKSSIKELIEKAENSFENSVNINDAVTKNSSDDSDDQKYQELPIEIREEIKREFNNFQKAFENKDFEGLISQNIKETIKNVLDEWLKVNLPIIVSEVIDEKINKITKNQ